MRCAPSHMSALWHRVLPDQLLSWGRRSSKGCVMGDMTLVHTSGVRGRPNPDSIATHPFQVEPETTGCPGLQSSITAQGGVGVCR